MIQDISPYRLDMAYRGTAPAPDDCFFSFRERMCFCGIWGRAQEPPVLRDLGHPAGEMESGRSCSGGQRTRFTSLGQEVNGCRGLSISPSVN